MFTFYLHRMDRLYTSEIECIFGKGIERISLYLRNALVISFCVLEFCNNGVCVGTCCGSDLRLNHGWTRFVLIHAALRAIHW